MRHDSLNKTVKQDCVVGIPVIKEEEEYTDKTEWIT